MSEIPFEVWFNSLVADGVLHEEDKAVALIGYAGGREMALLEAKQQQVADADTCVCGKPLINTV